MILGGSQENTVLSCEGQARLGHEVHLAFGPIYGPEGSLLARVEAFNARAAAGAERTVAGGAVVPIRTHVVPNMIREVSVRADWRAYGELRALIREIKPDVVHTHSSKAGILGRAAAWAERRAALRNTTDADANLLCGMGIVHTIHGPPFMPIDGGFVGKLKRRVNNVIYTVAERFAAGRCDLIVSVADAMTEQFLSRGIGHRTMYTTVRSGMEVELFLHARAGEGRDAMRDSLGIPRDSYVIGTVARLAEHKGHDDLLDALAEELKSRPTWKLLWVGDGWWRERLIARARGLGLVVRELDRDNSESSAGAHLYLTGLVPPERVAGLMRTMDVLAHPSSREGLPRTVPQGLLAGACPLAYDADGTREVCRDGETGRLIAVGNRAGLRAAAVALSENPASRAAMVERGRAWCIERFSAAAMVRDLEVVYARARERARERSRRRVV
jgi:glycosyltransferase involved in cell wall biosynthesis